ncbi:BTAD domain-containing putative transcriptional regulator [Paenibacillus sp. VCA1]|uniref:BTAD domain-containing putative transcriptional regulator n=1 Tax=Paenibacillus sp. VCA1 TaxID=3039148 RepID=UPI002871EEC8|nr:BTAD domain-containing putative transcriptional regulator [Paenibacillus sp. VCA1]MDR9857583.1 BTAD domain-containing putative transcriptional regulator [Paenibacillus sp. VCA1]
MLRAMIVDDEELSQKRLRRILSESGTVEICAAFLDPLEAYEYVRTSPIDVVFLDISMPEMNGMKLSSLLAELDDSIDLVFVTGYDEYALQAFEVNALDYVLKPVTSERIRKTLNKIGKRRGYAPAESGIAVHLFNGFKIMQRGQPHAQLKLRSPKTEELFAFLLCKGTVSKEEIIDTLWNGLEPQKAWKNLNQTLYYIRKAIHDNKAGQCIEAGRNDIRIHEGSVYCDLYEFENVAKQIRMNPSQHEHLLERALSLYTGPLLQGKSYEWAGSIIHRLEQKYLEMLEAAARHYLQCNDPAKSLYYFGEIVKRESLREDIHDEMIRLYARLGRKNEALQQYRLLEETLLQELGTRPEPHLKEHIEKLLHTN